jgi:membrane protein YdbS with pleckstrin-like domain
MAAPTHQGLYRNTPLAFGGLMGAIALLVAGIAAAMMIATTGDQLLPLVLGALALFVLTAVVCMLAALRRHRWTIEADAVLIEERPLVPLTGRRRARRVPFTGVAALSSVQNATDDLLTMTTRDGERFALPPRLAPGEGLVRRPDEEGLAAFAGQLRTAMTAAGHAAPPVAEGLGFWNRPAGLILLSIMLLASLALAVIALWGLWEGATVRHRGGEAVAILVLLPIGVGWILPRSWQRRRSVLQQMRQSPSVSG